MVLLVRIVEFISPLDVGVETIDGTAVEFPGQGTGVVMFAMSADIGGWLDVVHCAVEFVNGGCCIVELGNVVEVIVPRTDDKSEALLKLSV